jgi:hypothetical protein
MTEEKQQGPHKTSTISPLRETVFSRIHGKLRSKEEAKND